MAGLEQLVNDIKAKDSLHGLFVKGGITRPRIKGNKEEQEVDMLKMEMDKERK